MHHVSDINLIQAVSDYRESQKQERQPTSANSHKYSAIYLEQPTTFSYKSARV